MIKELLKVKNMQIIEIDKKKWVVDLDWEMLPQNTSIKIEAKKVAEKTQNNFGILIDYEDQVAIGLAKKSSKIPSAATYLSLANQEARANSSTSEYYHDWIVVEEAGDDKFWLAVIRNGTPSPQSDVILDITEVGKRILELLVNDTFKLYSTCSEIKAIFDETKYVEEVGLNALTANVKTKISYTKLRGIPNSVIYAGLGLIGFCFVTYGLSTLLEGRNLQEKAAAFEKQKHQEEMQKKMQYENDLKKYNELKEEAKKKVIQNVLNGMSASPNIVLSTWYDTVSGFELGSHGWKMDQIECYMTDATASTMQRSACDIKFIRNELSTNRMLLQEYPEAIIKGNEAVVTRLVPLPNDALINMSENDIKQLPTARDWGFDMISQLQLIKIVDIEHTIKPSVDLTYVSPVKPISPEMIATGKKPEPEKTESIGVAKGEIIIKNNNIDLLREVADNVDFKGIGTRKVVFKVQGLGMITWEATLEYFVQTDITGGITGSNSNTQADQTKEPNK